jgi:hypothetical protein
VWPDIVGINLHFRSGAGRLFILRQKIDTYRTMSMRTQLSTWDGKFSFEYERDAEGSITVTYGEGSRYSRSLEAPLGEQLIQTFAGRSVRVNHCLSEENIEDWLVKNGVRAGFSQYLAPILLHEGGAVEGARRGTIHVR